MTAPTLKHFAVIEDGDNYYFEIKIQMTREQFVDIYDLMSEYLEDEDE